MEKARHNLLLGLSLLQRRREARASAPAGVHRRVLIVSDDAADAQHLARLLLAKGYERVRVVRKAAKALLLTHTFSPSIVFLDVALPEDAYELASALRRQTGQGSLRIIALTSSIEHSTREQARDAGFERWLVTPVAESELDGLMRKEPASPT
jgi:CheY-like chemotaxis protein